VSASAPRKKVHSRIINNAPLCPTRVKAQAAQMQPICQKCAVQHVARSTRRGEAVQNDFQFIHLANIYSHLAER
jgi:hypothetical protein